MLSNAVSIESEVLPSGREWYVVLVAASLGGVITAFTPLSASAAGMLGITVFCVTLWVATPVPPWFTGLLGIGLIGVTSSTAVAFVGFTSPATWLIVLGILIGEATRSCGLAKSLEHWLVQHVPERLRTDALETFRFLLVVLSLVGFALALVVPSSLVRVLILAPILVSVGDLFSSRRAKLGILFGPLFATYYGGTGILTGSLSNIIIAGIVESATGQSITWAGWFVHLFPLMGLGRTLAIIAVTYALYRPRDRDAISFPTHDEFTVSAAERRMLAFLVVGVLFWATDFVHGLNPVYGALLVVLLAFVPRIGVVDLDVVTDADYSIVLFVAAIFAIAGGLTRTGVTDLAARTLLAQFPQHASTSVVLGAVVVVSSLVALLIEGLAAASVLTPILISFAHQTGVPLLPTVMIEAVTLNSYFFPYQSAVLVAILAQPHVEMRDLVRMTVVSSLVTLLVLVPLQVGLFVLS